METEFNNKHDAKLLKQIFVNGNPKHGEIVAHSQRVDWVSINIPVAIGRENYLKPHMISRDFIIDLYNQIIEIEKVTIDREYDNLPF